MSGFLGGQIYFGRELLVGLFIPFAIAAVLFGALVWHLGARSDSAERERNSPKYWQHKFAIGQIVEMRAFGVVGMVVSHSSCSPVCMYSLRFNALQQESRHGGLFSGRSNIDVAPVAYVRNIREYELQAYDGE